MFKTALLAAAIMLDATSANAACPVLMFITDWCPYCSSLQAELTARGIGYQTCDIEDNEDCRNALINQTGSAGVPVTFVCQYRIDGDDPDSVEEALGHF
jgi:glutaredoxin